MSKPQPCCRGRVAVFWSLVAALVLLQQVPWAWARTELVLGFIPFPLFYHVCISLACVALWWLGTRIAWPADEGNLTGLPREAEAAEDAEDAA